MSKQPRQSRRHRNAFKLKQRSRRILHAERLENRLLLTADWGLHNASFPNDVNLDGEITSNDVLIVINHLNNLGPAGQSGGSSPFASSAAISSAISSALRFHPPLDDL